MRGGRGTHLHLPASSLAVLYTHTYVLQSSVVGAAPPAPAPFSRMYVYPFHTHSTCFKRKEEKKDGRTERTPPPPLPTELLYHLCSNAKLTKTHLVAPTKISAHLRSLDRKRIFSHRPLRVRYEPPPSSQQLPIAVPARSHRPWRPRPRLRPPWRAAPPSSPSSRQCHVLIGARPARRQDHVHHAEHGPRAGRHRHRDQPQPGLLQDAAGHSQASPVGKRTI